VVIGINRKEVTSVDRGSPRAKADKNNATDGNKIRFFIARAKFAANMTNNIFENVVIFQNIDMTHTVTKHFGNNSITFIIILGKADFVRNGSIDKFSSLPFMLTSTSSIFNHVLIIKEKKKFIQFYKKSKKRGITHKSICYSFPDKWFWGIF